MKIQTEQLENHTTRLTVEVQADRLDKAKQTAAQRLAKRVNIPGFRKGKAPYRIVVNYLGEGAIIEDAVELLGNEIYNEALNESKVEPYGVGQLEDVKTEGDPVFTFVVPLQPTVELGDYRSVRLDFQVPPVEDEAVDRALKNLQEQYALVEESHQPVVSGNRVTLDIHGFVLDDGQDAENADAEAETAEDGEAEAHDHNHEEMFIHQHDAAMTLDPTDELAPGFVAALEGATAGEQRTFELEYPDDAEKYEDLAGKRARFEVTIKKIETVTLPALNDNLAARASEGEETPLTLLELRIRIRENLTRMAEDRTRSDYSRQVLDELVQRATVRYPEAMVAEQVQRFLQQFDQDLRQRGLTLDDYMTIYKKSTEDLYNDYRETAVRTVERALVMREIMRAEGLKVSSQEVLEEVERILAQFGGREEYRRLFRDPAMIESVHNDLLNQRILDRVVEIAKGEAPALSAETPTEASTTEGESVS